MTRGEIWWANLGEPFGSEPGFIRPTIIISSDSYNLSNISTVVSVSITTNLELVNAPGNILLKKEKTKLPKDSVVNVSQIATLDKKRFLKKVKKLEINEIEEIEKGLKLVLGL
jgi:mRNA interferase MazF